MRTTHQVLSHRSLAVLAVAILLAGGLVWGVAAAFGLSSSPSPAGKVTLRIAWPTEPNSLSPFIGYTSPYFEIYPLNYSFLFGCGDHNQPTLDLATEFPTEQNGGISPDGKVWTIHLRPNVKFQDGVPLTAADVAFTYNYIVKNDMSNLTNYTAGIKRVVAIDPSTVRIICAAPKPDLEKALVPILPKHIWENVSPAAAAGRDVDKPPIVGSGPFQTVEFVRGSYVKVVRNPYWYGKKPAIDEIYFELYKNTNTMVADLKAGTIDGAWGIPPAQFSSLGPAQGLKAVAYNYYSWDFLEFNCYEKPSSLGNPVLRDRRFRNALNYAIDRQQLCDIAYGGRAAPGTTVLTPDSFRDPDYHWQPSEIELYSFDRAKAGQLLTQAGYPTGSNGARLYKGKPITLRLMVTTSSPEQQTAAKLIAGWLTKLGLNIKLSVVDEGQYYSLIYNASGSVWKPDFDLAMSEWQGCYDPGQSLIWWTTGQIGSVNEPFWSNAEYDALAVQQGRTLDLQQRQDLIWRMQQIMYEQTPEIVLLYPKYLEAFNTAKWTGWTQMFDGTGPAFYCSGNYDSYLNLQPKVAESAGTTSGNLNVVAIVAVTAVAAAAVAALMLVRRRRREVEREV